jgi:toxin ParE1/3/4
VNRPTWHPLARRELLESSAYYENESPGLGDIFLDRIEDAVTYLQRFPRVAPVILAEIRQHLVSKFPYSLIYRVEDHGIFILAVAHHRRRPLYWARRVAAK